MNRVALVASAISLAAPVVLAASACSTVHEEPGLPDAASPADASAPDAPVDATLPTLPYPPGPYGGGIGEVMPNFRVQGYALSRGQRDSTKLPFRDITLAEVRSDPTCTCLVIAWSGAGDRCQPCLEGDAALSAAVASDPSLCALEVLQFMFDNVRPNEPPPPPTRADLDGFTQSGRQPFPVALVTGGAFDATGGRSFQGFPAYIAIRPSDMRVAGFSLGTGRDIAGDARAACASPFPPVEVLVDDIRPRRLVVDFAYTYYSDEAGGIFRTPLAGGPPVEIARASGVADALALDDDNLYWATRDGTAAFQVGQVPKSGGAPVILTAGASPYGGIALDATHVYFTRADGVVGRIPIGGGTVEALFAGEDAPSTIAVDDTNVYWIVSGSAIAAGSKDGSGRRVVSDPRTLAADLRAYDLVVQESNVFFRATSGRGAIVAGAPTSGGKTFEVSNEMVGAFALDRTPLSRRLAIAAINADDDAAAIGIIGATPRPTTPLPRPLITPGQRSVTAVASMESYLYWTSAPPNAPGSLRRIQR